MMSQDNVVAVLGAFASSLTLAISEVTERRGVPLLTMSFSDQITDRGFQNVFQIVSPGSQIGAATFDFTRALAQEAGQTLEKIAIMYEDTAYGTHALCAVCVKPSCREISKAAPVLSSER